MKRILLPMQRYPLLLVIFLGLSTGSSAQLNYLFSASTRPYTPVTNGIAPHLQSDYEKWEVEDEGFARVPIGFTFRYDGEPYSHANIHVNGFITLKDSLNIFYNYPYFTNRLKNAPPYNKRPVIAAFWDDLVLPDTLSLVYKTTGRAPFRVFTVEWKKVKWVYESLGPVLSIELKLYETTNIIEFQYKDEGNLPDPRYSYASIGITSDYANRGFISLQNTSSHPEISFLKANDSLHVKPADNQVYMFIPSILKIPAPLEPSLIYTNNKVSFQLGSASFNTYEYAISKSPIPPASGKKTFAGNLTISSLTPATTYYIYARSTFFGFFNSQWTCDSFTTAVNPVQLPYNPDIANLNLPPYLPADMRQQDFEDTSYYYDPSNGYWAMTDFPAPGDHAFAYFNTDFYNADNWLFTPGFELVGGKIYQLKFGYYSVYTYTEDEIASLEIKYGKANGAAAMTQGTLFKKTDIKSPGFYDNLIKTDTIIDFAPQASGKYYIGFHNMTPMFMGSLIITNIALGEKTSSPERRYVLGGKVENHDNVLTWGTDKHVEKNFVVERSKDGIGFEMIGNVSAGTNTKAGTFKQQNFKIPKAEVASIANIQDKHSKLFENASPQFLHGNKRIDFSKLVTGSTKNPTAHTETSITFNYRDSKPDIGALYYRLKQVKNGKSVYSNVIKLERQLQVDAVYPNPARDELSLKVKSIKDTKQRITITDASGKLVQTAEIQLSTGINNIRLSIRNLPANTYFIRINDIYNQPLALEKFIKQ